MKAPHFSLLDQDSKSWSLNDFAGKWLILYFYPKDDTPGCTTEACSFRDSKSIITKLNAEIVGVSKDSPASHKKFQAKYHFDHTLLSDPHGQTIEAYGAWGKKMFGHEGILRKTFIINPNGEIVKTYGHVTPLGHGDQLITDLEQIQK